MGILAIYKYIRAEVAKRCPDAIRQCKLSDYSGKAIAIDANAFVHRFSYGLRPGSHLYQTGHFFIDLLSHGIVPIFVFDGTSPKAKQPTKEKRDKKRQENRDRVARLTTEIETLKKTEGLVTEDGSPSPRKANVTPEKYQELKLKEIELDKAKKISDVSAQVTA